jgi:hypothetical protein
MATRKVRWPIIRPVPLGCVLHKPGWFRARTVSPNASERLRPRRLLCFLCDFTVMGSDSGVWRSLRRLACAQWIVSSAVMLCSATTWDGRQADSARARRQWSSFSGERPGSKPACACEIVGAVRGWALSCEGRAVGRPRKTEAVADEVTAVLDGVERVSIRVLGLIVEHVRLLCVRKCLLVQACQVFVGNRLPRH